jgi:hypothetical protein
LLLKNWKSPTPKSIELCMPPSDEVAAMRGDTAKLVPESGDDPVAVCAA